MRPDGQCEVDIVPLFETIQDLRNCAVVTDRALRCRNIGVSSTTEAVCRR